MESWARQGGGGSFRVIPKSRDVDPFEIVLLFAGCCQIVSSVPPQDLFNDTLVELHICDVCKPLI